MSILGILRILRILGILRIRRIRRIMYIPSTKHQAPSTAHLPDLGGLWHHHKIHQCIRVVCNISGALPCAAIPENLSVHQCIWRKRAYRVVRLPGLPVCLLDCQITRLPKRKWHHLYTRTPGSSSNTKKRNRRRMHACTHRVTICHVYHSLSLSLYSPIHFFFHCFVCVFIFFIPLVHASSPYYTHRHPYSIGVCFLGIKPSPNPALLSFLSGR